MYFAAIAPIVYSQVESSPSWNCTQVTVNNRPEWRCAAKHLADIPNPQNNNLPIIDSEPTAEISTRSIEHTPASGTSTDDLSLNETADTTSNAAGSKQVAPPQKTPIANNASDCGLNNPVDTTMSSNNNDGVTSLFDFEKQSQLPINASAKSVDIEKNKVVLTDDVEFQQGEIRLTADRGVVDTASNNITIDGNISIESPAGKISGDSAKINAEDNISEIINAQYALQFRPANGSAQRISSNDKQQIIIEQGSYSSCPNERKIWSVKAAKIVLDTEKNQGTAKHARLELFNTPVFYMPYARFPIGSERQSGVLFPTLANTNSGIDITLPFYANLAPNWDATLSPRYKDSHGYITEAETRWLNNFDRWEVSGAYIGHDAQFESDSALNTPYPKDSRWVVGVKENGSNRAGFQTLIDYTKVSDDDYFRDIDATSLSINRTTHLRQHAEFNYLSQYFSGGTAVSRYQTIDPNIAQSDRPVRALPTAWLKLETPKTFNRPVAAAKLRYSSFEHPTRTEADRSYGNIALSLPLRLGGLYLTPKLGIEHLHYAISNVDAATNPLLNDGQSISFSAPYGDVKLAAVFEKHGRNTVSTLEPSLHYHYQKITGNRADALLAPNFDSDWLSFDARALTRESRLSGFDSIEETNQLASAITHHITKRDGSPLLSTTLGYLQYFQRVTSRYSDLDTTSIIDNALQNDNQAAAIFDMRGFFHSQWETSLSTLWDERRNRIEAGQAAIHYRQHASRSDARGNSNIMNLRYHYRRAEPTHVLLTQNIEQLDASFVSAITSSVGLLGRFQYDLHANRSIETLAGAQYENCCIKLRLVYRDGLIYDVDSPSNESRDRSLFLQIQFKGLMGIGNAVENLLEESIFGYRTATY